MDDTANKFDFLNSTGGIFFSEFHWWNLIKKGELPQTGALSPAKVCANPHVSAQMVQRTAIAKVSVRPQP